jgi:hypothetical protein
MLRLLEFHKFLKSSGLACGRAGWWQNNLEGLKLISRIALQKSQNKKEV